MNFLRFSELLDCNCNFLQQFKDERKITKGKNATKPNNDKMTTNLIFPRGIFAAYSFLNMEQSNNVEQKHFLLQKQIDDCNVNKAILKSLLPRTKLNLY